MVDENIVEAIRKHGVFKDTGEGRVGALREMGFRLDEKAEYVIIGGCLQPEGMPHSFTAFQKLLELLGVDYTLLSKEYCCGWMPIGQPAVMAKDEAAIEEWKKVGKEFIRRNYEQAEALGARSVALFCAACEPNYTDFSSETELELITYVDLLDIHFDGGELHKTIDYYPGCFRFRRKITKEPIDISPADRILGRIEGLTINRVDPSLCCYIPPHTEKIKEAVSAKSLVTLCTGCSFNLTHSMKDIDGLAVKMLPELMLESRAG
jgi:Fe-S oxidoreductase